MSLPAEAWIPPAWTEQASCAFSDAEAWFPEVGQASKFARRICAECPVQAECLQAGLEGHEVGVWGGTSEHDRKRMRGAA